MKKLFGAVIVGTMVFGAIFVSASTLPLVAGTGSIQSSSLASVTCQNTPVSVKYQTETNGQGENQIAAVILGNIEASCFGDQAAVNLFSTEPPYSGLTYSPGAGANVWIEWGTISGSTITLPFGAGSASGSLKPLAAAILHYNVMFSAQ